MGDEFKMTPAGEFVMYVYLEVASTEEAEVKKQYRLMDACVEQYLSLLHSASSPRLSLVGTVPIVTLYSCHYLDVLLAALLQRRFLTPAIHPPTSRTSPRGWTAAICTWTTASSACAACSSSSVPDCPSCHRWRCEPEMSGRRTAVRRRRRRTTCRRS